jgi:hypothetical protein
MNIITFRRSGREVAAFSSFAHKKPIAQLDDIARKTYPMHVPGIADAEISQRLDEMKRRDWLNSDHDLSP